MCDCFCNWSDIIMYYLDLTLLRMKGRKEEQLIFILYQKAFTGTDQIIQDI